MSTTYRPTYVPTTEDIRQTFADEIATLGGTVPDVYDDDDRLFARAVLRTNDEIRPGDRVSGGVAIRAAGPELLIHPYTYRQVCSNGAIAAHALETRRIERLERTEVFVSTYDVSVVHAELRAAIQAAAAKQTFETIAHEMRSASEIDADFALNLLPMLARLPAGVMGQWVPHIFQRFTDDGDRSAFGLMNAVTSVARDVRDPEVRWRLEALGGGVPARLVVAPASATGVTAVAAHRE